MTQRGDSEFKVVARLFVLVYTTGLIMAVRDGKEARRGVPKGHAR